MREYIPLFLLFFVGSLCAIGDGPNEIGATEEEYVFFMRESILQIEDNINNENVSEEIDNKRILHHILSNSLTHIQARKKGGELSASRADDLVQHYTRVISVVMNHLYQNAFS